MAANVYAALDERRVELLDEILTQIEESVKD